MSLVLTQKATCAVWVSAALMCHQHPGYDGVNDWLCSSIGHSHWTKFTKSGHFVHVFLIIAVVTYLKARICIHRQKLCLPVLHVLLKSSETSCLNTCLIFSWFESNESSESYVTLNIILNMQVTQWLTDGLVFMKMLLQERDWKSEDFYKETIYWDNVSFDIWVCSNMNILEKIYITQQDQSLSHTHIAVICLFHQSTDCWEHWILRLLKRPCFNPVC